MDARNAAASLGRRAGSALSVVSRSAYQKVREPEWVRAAIENLPRPATPLTQPWEMSIATLVGRHPMVPGAALTRLRRLDQFGQVSITPNRVGFDGRTVNWDKVLAVRVHSTGDLVPGVVMDHEVDRIRDLLPPLPGRRWAVATVAEVMLTLVMAAVEWPARDGADAPMLPCEIVYKGRFGRTHTMSAGLFAAAILAVLPEASDSLIATARARGIPVQTVVGNRIGSRSARARWLRDSAERLAQRVRELRAEDDDCKPDALPATEGNAARTAGAAAPGADRDYDH